MTKVCGVNKFLIIIFLIFIFLFSSCKKEEEIDINLNNEGFFEKFSKYENIEEIQINKLDLYYQDAYYFFDIEYTNESLKTEYHLLFIYQLNAFDTFFSLKYENECVEYYGNDYSLYLNAKESGLHRLFTQEEISSYLVK